MGGGVVISAKAQHTQKCALSWAHNWWGDRQKRTRYTPCIILKISVRWTSTIIVRVRVVISLSMMSRCPGRGLGWIQNRKPIPGSKPSTNPHWATGAALYPRCVIELTVLAQGNFTCTRFHLTVCTSLTTIQYISSDYIMTWFVCRLCSFLNSFTSFSQLCDPTYICWLSMK